MCFFYCLVVIHCYGNLTTGYWESLDHSALLKRKSYMAFHFKEGTQRSKVICKRCLGIRIVPLLQRHVEVLPPLLIGEHFKNGRCQKEAWEVDFLPRVWCSCCSWYWDQDKAEVVVEEVTATSDPSSTWGRSLGEVCLQRTMRRMRRISELRWLRESQPPSPL